MTKFGVIVFPGSNCDRDIVTVTKGILGQPTHLIWHQDRDLQEVDVVMIPGDLVMETISAAGRSPDFPL